MLLTRRFAPRIRHAVFVSKQLEVESSLWTSVQLGDVGYQLVEESLRPEQQVVEPGSPRARQPDFVRIQAALEEPEDAGGVVLIVVGADQNRHPFESSSVSELNGEAEHGAASIDESGPSAGL